jgi:hypothetical protein
LYNIVSEIQWSIGNIRGTTKPRGDFCVSGTEFDVK